MLATIIGRIPKLLFDGFHFVPSRNFSGPIFPIAGIPFANRNAHIRNTASTDVQAAIRNTHFMAFSLKWFIHYTFLSLFPKTLLTYKQSACCIPVTRRTVFILIIHYTTDYASLYSVCDFSSLQFVQIVYHCRNP